MRKKFPDQYLHVTECRSGITWIVPFGDNDPLNLETNVKAWIASEYGGDFELDGAIMPRLEGEFYAKILTDNRPPESTVVWQSGGFYLKAIELTELELDATKV